MNTNVQNEVNPHQSEKPKTKSMGTGVVWETVLAIIGIVDMLVCIVGGIIWITRVPDNYGLYLGVLICVVWFILVLVRLLRAQTTFIIVLMFFALQFSSIVFFGIFGAAEEKSLLHHLYQGGPLVVLLLTLTIMDVTFIVERMFTLWKARGKGPMPNFLLNVEQSLQRGDVDGAINSCSFQRGSLANIIRTALERYKTAVTQSKVEAEKRMAEVQRAIDEAMMLEVPLLEKNLIALSTIASIATMVGLLGTVIGMIRAFQALARQGAPDAVNLSIGISEALVNTAGGLIAAIIGIVAYNYFVNKVDSFTYMIDEASFNVVQILSERK